MGDDGLYWEQLSDGTPPKEAQSRFTRILNLVTKLHYRLQEALEGEAQAYMDTQTTNNNGLEIIRLLKCRYKIENQYTETDLITKAHAWSFDQTDLERSIIEWERIMHRLRTQHNYELEPRVTYAMLIRGLPEDLRLAMLREGVADWTTLRQRVTDYCTSKLLSDPATANSMNAMNSTQNLIALKKNCP